MRALVSLLLLVKESSMDSENEVFGQRGKRSYNLDLSVKRIKTEDGRLISLSFTLFVCSFVSLRSLKSTLYKSSIVYPTMRGGR